MTNILSIAAGILQFSCPVAFASIGESIGQRTGVFNIGLEGIMLTAAFVSVQTSVTTGSVWAGFLAGILTGVLLSLLQALLTVCLAIDQVVAGTALNLAGLGLTSTLFNLGVQSGVSFSGTPKVPLLFGMFDPFVVLLFVLAAALQFGLFRTGWGLLARATGDYPPSVESAGFRVSKIRLAGQAIVGAMTGLAGAHLALSIAGGFNQNMTVGRGFIAIALVTFGRFRPWGALAASVLIGFLEWLQLALQGRSPVPVQFFTALPYLAALAVLVLLGKGARAPNALGVPYRQDR